MKKYKVIVTPKAQQDLKEFVDYIKTNIRIRRQRKAYSMIL